MVINSYLMSCGKNYINKMNKKKRSVRKEKLNTVEPNEF